MNYLEDTKRQYGVMKLLGMREPVLLEGIFTNVNLRDKPTRIQVGSFVVESSAEDP